MVHTVNDISMHYIRYGNKSGKTLVFLHGWGQNIDMMKPVADPYGQEYDIIIVDLPGHGESEEPTRILKSPDFVECIKSLIDNLKIRKPILIGHSFGGKISLLYDSKYEVDNRILFGNPFKKEIKK